jgi:hypothetical protein
VAIKLEAAAVAEIGTKRSYPKSAWSTVVDRFVAGSDAGIGKIEADFPGVKPAHVAHMLRLDLKTRNLGSKAKVAIDKKYGVTLTR